MIYSVIKLLLAFSMMAVPQAGPVAPAEDIIINGADSIWTRSTSLAPEIQVRAVKADPRSILQSADTICHLNVALPPGQLRMTLSDVTARPLVASADGTSTYVVAYPTALINDPTAPRLESLRALMMNASSAVVTWQSDEYATSELLLGEEAGSLSSRAKDDLYAKQHRVIITGLRWGTQYHLQVRSSDRSGNIASSPVTSFVASQKLYLPIICQYRLAFSAFDNPP